jgi:hypothetical protein
MDQQDIKGRSESSKRGNATFSVSHEASFLALEPLDKKQVNLNYITLLKNVSLKI